MGGRHNRMNSTGMGSRRNRGGYNVGHTGRGMGNRAMFRF